MKNECNSVTRVSNRILLSRGNLMKLILAVLIFITVAFIPSFLSSGILYLCGVEFDENGYAIMSDLSSIIMSLSVIALYLFLIIPTISGVLLVAKDIVEGEEAQLTALFSPFKKPRRYFRSLLIGVVTVIVVGLPIFVIAGAASLSTSVYSTFLTDENLLLIPFAFFLASASIGAIVVSFWGTSFLLFVPGLLLEGESLLRAIRKSFLLARGLRSGALGYMVICLVLTLISLLTLGILFVIYVAPFILVSYFVLLNERKLLRLSCSDSGMETI